jgi:hypothetical protein
MKRILLSVLALSFVLSGSAFATVRTNGMAIDQDDTMDYGNIYAFPQLTGKYANILSVVPTGGGWNANGELLINMGDKTFTIGYAAGETNFLGGSYAWSDISNDAENGIGYGGSSGSDPDQKFQLGFAMPMGSGLIGARFSWSRYGYENSNNYTDDAGNFGIDDSYVDNSSQIKIEAGYGMEEAGPFKSLDLGAKIAIGSGEVGYEDRDTDNDPNTSEAAFREGVDSDGATDIGIRLRGVKEIGEGSLVVNLGFQTSSLNAEAYWQEDGDGDGSYQSAGVPDDYDETYRIEKKQTDISVGVAYNRPINDGGLLVLSARLSNTSRTSSESQTFWDNSSTWFGTEEMLTGYTDYEEKESYLSIPLAVGVEDKLSDSLKGRLGIKKNFFLNYNYKETDGTDYDLASDSLLDTYVYEESYKPDSEDATLYIGLSATKGKFYSDWVIEHDIFWNGPEFIFGTSGGSFAAEWEVGLTF